MTHKTVYDLVAALGFKEESHEYNVVMDMTCGDFESAEATCQLALKEAEEEEVKRRQEAKAALTKERQEKTKAACDALEAVATSYNDQNQVEFCWRIRGFADRLEYDDAPGKSNKMADDRRTEAGEYADDWNKGFHL